jgi:hypothetical protein
LEIASGRQIPTMRRLAVLVLLVPLVAACNGGTVDLHALSNDSDAIDSLACEGSLLANQVVHGASTSPFTRVHAGELSTRASNFEDALSSRPTTPGIERAVRREADKAGRIAGLLDELAQNPTDTERAAGLKNQLEQAGCP